MVCLTDWIEILQDSSSYFMMADYLLTKYISLSLIQYKQKYILREKTPFPVSIQCVNVLIEFSKHLGEVFWRRIV